MTLYVGEVLRITATAREFNADALTDDNTDGVTVKIYDSTPALIVDNDMTWDAEEALWYYLWDTVDLDTGSYKYQIIFTGTDGNSSWEWYRTRLARDKVVLDS